MIRRSPLGLALGVAAVALLTHARPGRADCANVAEVFNLELERVTVNGAVVADTAPWRRSTLSVGSNYPGQGWLVVSPDAGVGASFTLRPDP